LEELRTAGVQVDPHREDYDYGRLSGSWTWMVIASNIELWEPPKGDRGKIAVKIKDQA
jgi:hypothetical protein